MNARHIKRIAQAFQNPAVEERNKMMKSVILSSVLVVFLMLSVRVIDTEFDNANRKKTLESLTFKVDRVVSGAVESAAVLKDRHSACTAQDVSAIKLAVQMNAYIRSITFFDSSGNIFCSSSTGQDVIPYRMVNSGVRDDIRHLINEKSSNISMKIITGSNRVPDQNAVVIFIPVNNGMMTVAIDARYFTSPFNAIYLVNHTTYALETGGKQLSWNGLTKISDSGAVLYQKKSTLFPYKIVEVHSEEDQDLFSGLIFLVFFSSAFVVFFLTSRWTLTRFYSRESYIIKALREKAFSFDIQPVFTLNENRPVGGEVLIRWRLDQSVTIPPNLFIPLTEKMNIVNDLGEFLLRDIAERISNQSLTLPPFFRLNFNIHSSHFEQESLVTTCRYFMDMTRKHNISLVLELTERQELSDLVSVQNSIMELTELGIEMAVDDFGTGSSGLRYLYNKNFDCIKTDRSLIEEALINPLACTVMESSIQLAQKVGKIIVVEGVESQQQLDLIKKMNLKSQVLIQGYLLSRPLSLQQLGNLLSNTV